MLQRLSGRPPPSAANPACETKFCDDSHQPWRCRRAASLLSLILIECVPDKCEGEYLLWQKHSFLCLALRKTQRTSTGGMNRSSALPTSVASTWCQSSISRDSWVLTVT